jgi:hypothetical protein
VKVTVAQLSARTPSPQIILQDDLEPEELEQEKEDPITTGPQKPAKTAKKSKAKATADNADMDDDIPF